MDAAKSRIKGSDYAGVFCTASDELVFAPLHLTEKERDILSKTLKADIIELSLGESNLVGLFSRANSNGIIVSNLATENEVRELRAKVNELNVAVLHSSVNAIGSNILVNDRIAIINEEYSERDAKLIGDVFGVEVCKMVIGGFKTVGANNILTNAGLVINNRATDLEQKEWEEKTGFKTIRTTANTGSLAVGLSVVVNSKGIVAGESTTGFELNRMLQGLER